jgi:hypothetical protein
MDTNLVLQGQKTFLLLERIAENERKILSVVSGDQRDITELVKETALLNITLINCCQETQTKLNQILVALQAIAPPSAVGLAVSIEAFNSKGELTWQEK